ncbi:choline transport protein, partial [Colletotrichum salicis]
MDAEQGPTSKPPVISDQAAQGAGDLADLGHSQALSRKFDTWGMLSLAFVFLGTWSVFAQSLASGLNNGGPITILWGLCLVTFCNTCIGVFLGEICSSMPIAMGQAYWVSQLWPIPAGRFTSYLCAWINTFGWWTLSASTVVFVTEFILGMNLLFDETATAPQAFWVQFLVYLGTTVLSTLLNVVSCRRDKTLAYGLTAFDAAIHLVEEIPAPRKNVPRVIWLSTICGAATGFLFMVVCLFSIQDLEQVLDPTTGPPFMDLVRSTVGLQGAAVLIALFIINGLGQGVTVVTTASRLTWGFARDGGIPWSSYFSHVDEKWKAPVSALWLQEFIIGLVGLLYTFSKTVLEAIVG